MLFGLGALYGFADELTWLVFLKAVFLCVCISDVTFFKPKILLKKMFKYTHLLV